MNRLSDLVQVDPPACDKRAIHHGIQPMNHLETVLSKPWGKSSDFNTGDPNRISLADKKLDVYHTATGTPENRIDARLVVTDYPGNVPSNAPRQP